MDKIQKLKDEIIQGLSITANFASLKHKFDMLKDFCKAKSILKKSGKGEALKHEINEKMKEVKDQPDIKENMEALKAEVEKLRVYNDGDLYQEAKKIILKLKKGIDLELANYLKLCLKHKFDMLKDFCKVKSILKKSGKGEALKHEINEKMKEVKDQPDMKENMEALKAEVEKLRVSNDGDLYQEAKKIILKLKKGIDLELANYLKLCLKHKFDMLKDFCKVKSILKKSGKGEALKHEINEKMKEVKDQPDMKENMEALKAEVEKLRVSNDGDLYQEAKKIILKLKKGIDLELANYLRLWFGC
ncbi:hypothetical protein K2173_007026 [Erythroxylum novogranatense]|uniref:Uncharacterized protein n=1 Tax=Erythroxylum novogranatense TaxID=1862640 RepID=A0AAV8SL40_9ROSI|nr:hypothetical protein K2173_007026 [Erythroxylum novogranatense]